MFKINLILTIPRGFHVHYRIKRKWVTDPGFLPGFLP